LQQAAMFTIFGVVVLIAALVTNELFSSTKDKRSLSSLVRRLKITILPLLFAFAVIVAMKIWEVI